MNSEQPQSHDSPLEVLDCDRDLVDEQPTWAAKLVISLLPDRTVPAPQARYLITTFGIIAVGIMGAVLTVLAAPAQALGWFLGLAVAELALALGGIFVIARQGRATTRRRFSR